MSRKAGLGWAAALTGSVVLYGPLIIWADNAWDLSSPQTLFLVAFVEFVVAYVLVIGPAAYLSRSWPLTIALNVALFLTLYWGRFGTVGLLVVIAIGLGAVTSAQFTNEATPVRVVGATVLILTVVPMAQVFLEHIQDRPSITMVTPPDPGEVRASGDVEDVLLLVVDGYPMSYVAEEWFDHDASAIEEPLAASGFQTHDVSWSQDSYTRFAIPSMLQLTQSLVTDESDNWGNQKAAYDISRGDNLVAKAMRSAGFTYTHIESGWNGDVCGQVDVCHGEHWLSETSSTLLSLAAFDPIVQSLNGSWYRSGTMHSFSALDELNVWDDGIRDFVYAHFMFPHQPFIVDSDCSLTGGATTDSSVDISAQFACVDNLLLEVIEGIGPNAAVVITGDHGTDSRNQRERDADDWDDDDILERLGAFLAYRLPDGCDPAQMPTNVHAMRAVVRCATDLTIPADEPGFVIGGTTFSEVTAADLARIESKLAG